MVFDNCQIDVFFHMRSHYNRLRNVQSVVDCSPPKGLKRSAISDTSFQYVGMAHPPTYSCGVKRHNCGYANYAAIMRPDGNGRSPRARSLPSRPGTRRHPADMPCTPEVCSRSGKMIPPSFSRWAPCGAGKLPFSKEITSQMPRYHKGQTAEDSICNKNFDPTICTLYEANSAISRPNNSRPGTARVVRINAESSQGKSTKMSQQACIIEGQPKESFRPNTPTSPRTCRDADVSPQDHEYLQFLLRITEDIIKNDLYTNKEMKKVFMSHINANKGRLSLDRMLLQVHELMNELSMPFTENGEDDATSSWTEIETAMKGLLCLEKIKPKETTPSPKSIESKFKSTPPADRKCICFDLRTVDQNVTTNKMPEEEIENLNYEDYAKFKNSLDRLTELTEPISSRATVKASTATSCSTFGNVDVLPGFECLETPAFFKDMMFQELYRKRSPERPPLKTICDGPCVRRKSKSPKRRRKSRSPKKKRPRSSPRVSKQLNCQENVTQTTAQAQSRGTDPHTLVMAQKLKNDSKPIVISLQECKPPNNQANGDDLCLRNSRNDYVLIRGPIYLLKTFLDENPNIVMRIEMPSVSTKSFASHLIPSGEETSERNSTQKSQTLDISENNTEYNFPKNNNNEYEEKDRITTEAFEEARRILLQLTSFPVKTTLSPTSCETGCRNEHLCIPGSRQEDMWKASIISSEDLAPPPYRYCKTPCPNESECTQFNTALLEMPCSKETESKLMSNDYDLTPQKEYNSKENRMDKLAGEDYLCSDIVPVLLHGFLMTKQIQTEDIHIGPSIVATALIQQDKSADTLRDPPESTSNQAKVRETHSDPTVDDFSKEEEMNTALNVSGEEFSPSTYYRENESIPLRHNEILGISGGTNFDRFLEQSSIIFPKIINDKTDDVYVSQSNTVPSKSTATSIATVTSTATVERTNLLLDEVEEEIHTKAVSPVYQELNKNNNEDQRDSLGVDSEDMREVLRQRRVSILKNPIVQNPVEKIFSEIDITKKKGESIIKAVEVLKERQQNKDNFLSRAMQDIESGRESRLSEKINSEERSIEPTPPLPHSLLKDPVKSGRTDYVIKTGRLNITEVSSIEEVYGAHANPSYDELPINISSLRQTDSMATPTSDSAVSSDGSLLVSKLNFLPEMDEQPELKLSSSQQKHIIMKTAKLDQFRHANDKDEREISATLDKLVDTLKNQQETDDEIQLKDDDSSEQQSVTSTGKSTFSCCGFRKKKKAFRVKPIHEPPQQTSFSEQEYKHRSEQFELALAGLGSQKQTVKGISKEVVQEFKIVSPKHDEEKENKTPIVHSGNRLSLVRIADDRDKSEGELNVDFDTVSTTIASLSDNEMNNR